MKECETILKYGIWKEVEMISVRLLRGRRDWGRWAIEARHPVETGWWSLHSRNLDRGLCSSGESLYVRQQVQNSFQKPWARDKQTQWTWVTVERVSRQKDLRRRWRPRAAWVSEIQFTCLKGFEDVNLLFWNWKEAFKTKQSKTLLSKRSGSLWGGS